MVFFAQNKEKAIQYVKRICQTEGIKYKEPRLAKKQIPHCSKFKTWTWR